VLDTSRIRALLFDMDGTLADTDDAYIARAARLIRPAHFIFPGRDPTRFLRWGVMRAETPLNWLMTVPDQLQLDHSLAAITDWFHRWRGPAKAPTRPAGPEGAPGAPAQFVMIDGAAAMLDALAAHYPLALVTSRDRRGVDAFLEQFGLRPYFKVVVSALSAARIKPHPAPVLFAAETLGLPASECIMIGDTTVDIEAGRRAGAQTVGVLCGFGEREELQRAGAHLILERTPQLLDTLLTHDP
jgi:N-acetyl-D-muramate 6-phosphate phosphatase